MFLSCMARDNTLLDVGFGLIRYNRASCSSVRLLLPQVAQLHAAALAEDASVFAYDEVYDSLKESEKPKREEKKERKSKYIEGLLDKAKERNKEQDIIYERG